MFNIVIAEFRAVKLCRVSVWGVYTVTWELSLHRRKSLGTGNDAVFKRRAKIAWLQWIFEFHTPVLLKWVRLAQAVLVDEMLTVLLAEKITS